MRYLMTFSYDGTNFSGYQIQNNKRTIEEEIEKQLTKINHNENIKIIASGRTDAHVHALSQKAHFDMDNISGYDLKLKLNKMLPQDIYIKNIEKVDKNFHARYNSKEKEYIYKINLGEYNPLEVNYVYQYNKDLNIKNMIEVSEILKGTHDFTSFTASSGKKENMVRTITNITFNMENNILIISFKGNGFLRYQVRNMVSILVEAGENKKTKEEVREILDSKDRKNASKTFSPVGLYLKEVKYL